MSEIIIRKAKDRGRTAIDWLDSRHTFSFGGYHDPGWMGFGALRVINDDVVAPGNGFPMHPHRDMEILTWVVSGSLEHRDSMGNGDVILPGEVQRMSAGRGIMHSEWNPSEEEAVRLLQIWIEPSETGIAPGYEKARPDAGALDGRLVLIASPEGGDGVAAIRQDARVYAGRIPAGQEIVQSLDAARRTWVQVVTGRLRLNGREIEKGDGAALTGEESLHLLGLADAEILTFDLR